MERLPKSSGFTSHIHLAHYKFTFVKGWQNLGGDGTNILSITFKQINPIFYCQFSQLATAPDLLL